MALRGDLGSPPSLEAIDLTLSEHGSEAVPLDAGPFM